MKPWAWIGIGGLLLFWSKLQAAGMVQIENVTAQLPRNGQYGSRPLDMIEMFVLHHSATSGGDPWAFARYHIEENGWPGIGYHFVIQPDGKIYQTNKLTTISYHAGGVNTTSLGICLVGNHDVTTPPPRQYSALIGLLRHLRNLIGQKPIYGHNQFSSKSCPGALVDVNLIQAEAWGENPLV